MVSTTSTIAPALLSLFQNPLDLGFVSRILVVGDGSVGRDPVTPFDWTRMIAAIRGYTHRLGSFEVDLAHRGPYDRVSSSPEPAFKFLNFRFDASVNGKRVIDSYDQIWLFGFEPGNGKPPDDAEIMKPGRNPLSDSELFALSSWMNAGGGVFATGDHFFMGASMCSRVPRVNKMRRWTIAQGVPNSNIGDTSEPFKRVDTNRPEKYGSLEPPNFPPYLGSNFWDYYIRDEENQQDATPQDIEWTRYLMGVLPDDSPFPWDFAAYMPHPLLCHPLHGPIDVMPDHSHEGMCFGPDEFDTSDGHFPEFAGIKPIPEVVAYGKTLRTPPYYFEIGLQKRRPPFPMIVAYDGQMITLGRVVVDSTWHHWFDYNLVGLKGVNLDKVERYFVNVAIWLASPRWRQWDLYGEVVAAHMGYYGYQTFNPRASAYANGRSFIQRSARTLGRCWIVSILTEDILRTFNPQLYTGIREHFRSGGMPGIDRGVLSFETFEAAIAGGIVKQVYARLDPIREEYRHYGSWPATISKGELEEDLRLGIAHGLNEISQSYYRELRRSSGLMDIVRDASRKGNEEFESKYSRVLNATKN
ncbi:MAG TPA: hypothetical protein VJT81_09690 [Burkholderiales bacterium]|nr:hypothetical protein [Burkholderiales bacterium]